MQFIKKRAMETSAQKEIGKFIWNIRTSGLKRMTILSFCKPTDFMKLINRSVKVT